MDDTAAKIFSAIILFLATLLIGAVPVQLIDYFSRKRTKKQQHIKKEILNKI